MGLYLNFLIRLHGVVLGQVQVMLQYCVLSLAQGQIYFTLPYLRSVYTQFQNAFFEVLDNSLVVNLFQTEICFRQSCSTTHTLHSWQT
jgi:hypothetical protein